MTELEKLWKSCIQCESDFYLKESDQKFFESKDLELPKRCWTCRQKNKRDAAEARAKQEDKDRLSRSSGNRKPRSSPKDGGAHETTTLKYTRKGRNK